MVTVSADVSSVVGNLNNLSKDTIQRGLNLTAQNMISELMARSPVDHGLLRSWAVTGSSGNTRTIQSPAEYAVYQNYGTSAHWVAPVSAKALHWDGLFSKGHMVSGIEGKHFVEDSIEATSARIQEFFTIKG